MIDFETKNRELLKSQMALFIPYFPRFSFFLLKVHFAIILL